MKAALAMIDILGYKNLVETISDDEQVFNTILNAINSAKESAAEIFNNVVLQPKFSNHKWQAIYAKFLEDVSVVSISDAIIIYIPLPDTLNEENYFVTCKALIGFSSMIHVHFFNQGLPTRGHVCVGNLFKAGNTFGGNAFIEAYKKSDALDMSAITIDSGLVLSLNAISERNQFKVEEDPLFYTNYITPKNERHGSKKLEPEWLATSILWQSMKDKNIKLECEKAFSGFGRDINNVPVRSKIKNTQLFLYEMLESVNTFIKKSQPPTPPPAP